jgi:hypothetical protein
MFGQKNRCRHIAYSGYQCRRPSLEGQPFCYQHARFSEPQPAPPRYSREPAVMIPLLDDRATVQVVIAEVMRALVTRSIAAEEARALFYGLQLASANLGRIEKSTKEQEPVVSIEHEHPQGPELGPEIEFPASEEEQEMSEALQTWAESDPIMSEVLKGVREAKRLRSRVPQVPILGPGRTHSNLEYRSESPGDYFIHDSVRSHGQITDFNSGLAGQFDERNNL